MKLAFYLLFAASVCAHSVEAQDRARSQADSTRRSALDSIRITAERSDISLATTTSSVTVISNDQLRKLPVSTVADVLRLVPGVSVPDRDGLGYSAQPTVRGFFGGGEAEYVQLLIDGKPVAQVESGLSAWDALPPLSQVERIEILRGGSSSLWGDAAVGAVMNIVTRSAHGAVASGTSGGMITAGSNLVHTSAFYAGTIVGNPVTANIAYDKVTGFRDHSDRDVLRLNAAATVVNSEQNKLSVAARAHTRRIDEPGAITTDVLRSSSDIMHRFDATADNMYAVQLDGTRAFTPTFTGNAAFLAESRSNNSVKTIALAPAFGDTREREGSATRFWGTAQIKWAELPSPWEGNVSLGVDVSSGSVRSQWYGVHTGVRSSYEEVSGDRGEKDADGTSSRRSAALFAQYSASVTSRVSLVAGARLDHIADSYLSHVSDLRWTNSHAAFSPKLAVSVRYKETPTSSGNFFANVSRSFRAPTLDQRYDQRPVPLPEPPYSITTSSPTLLPQYGLAVEMGVYQLFTIRDVGSIMLSGSAYEMDMRDEIDFDVSLLRYQNLMRSKHRGLETGVQFTSFSEVPVWFFASHALQSVTAQHGVNSGRKLKAIPSHVLYTGAGVDVGETRVSLTAAYTGTAFLDDSNSETIPAFTRLDTRLSRRLYTSLSVQLDILNILDREYYSTAYPDPSGAAVRYVSPAARRQLQLSLLLSGERHK